MPMADDLIDQLLEGSTSREDILGEEGLLKQLSGQVAERILDAEVAFHLGYAQYDSCGKNTGNSRNGKSRKAVRSVDGAIDLKIPRDRNGSFEPKLIKKSTQHIPLYLPQP